MPVSYYTVWYWRGYLNGGGKMDRAKVANALLAKTRVISYEIQVDNATLVLIDIIQALTEDELAEYNAIVEAIDGDQADIASRN